MMEEDIQNMYNEDIQNMYNAVVNLGLINWIKTYEFRQYEDYDNPNLKMILDYPDVDKHGHSGFSFRCTFLEVQKRIINDYNDFSLDI